jgi:hypothetical protein
MSDQHRASALWPTGSKVDPGAVHMTNLGFSAVDYGRAAASALQE